VSEKGKVEKNQNMIFFLRSRDEGGRYEGERDIFIQERGGQNQMAV